jgi:hypothetical protein
VSYVISGDESDPANQFADLKEIERVETKPAEAPAEQSASEAGTTPEPGPAEGFSMETEYLDPEESKCAECGSSFGIHLKTCSQFKDPNAPAAEKPKAEPKDNGPLPLFAW